MEKVLELYKYIDGTNDVAFPSVEQQVITSDFRYDVKRMGGAPMITCTIKHELCLDKLWTDNVYAMFNGERFFIKQVPTSSYDNTDCRYKHDVELVSERIILDNVYFYDVVDSGASYDKPVSNSSNFTFFGDIHQFVARMNESLRYSNVGYSVVVDSGISSEDKQVAFQDQFFSNVLQEIYNTYELPYYFDKKVIHVGYTSNAITHTLKYGRDESLLSIQKQNANYKIVNRVTGVGSQDNIPYYYPNDYESKEEVEANGGTWINPQTNLMPPIYRSSLGRERFYNAMNGTYISPETGDYYVFDNPYIVGKPKEHIVNFEDIKPSIKGMTNASGYRIDMFMDFAYDANDNDETDEEGNYKHPYFFAKLRRFDGANGFNLFDHAIDESEMTISMTSGSLGACEFVIGVDEDSQKNTVQVDENGNLERDENGNIKFGTPQDKQNDTQNNEVWIALRKDVETFGVIMPNASSNYKPSTNDTFVILHIDLPKSYILAAEEKLKDELIKYMALNNDEKFNFSITFSRIFFAENPAILEQLDENARVQVEYDNERYELYVSSYSYTMSSSQLLPEVKVELSDTLTISQNALQLAISEVKHDIMTSFGGGDFLKQGLKYFLRKDVDDRTRGTLSSDKGFVVGKFVTGTLGTGASMYQDKDKNTHIEADYLKIRKKATFTEITVQELKHVGGEIILSPAAMICSKVEETEIGYKCYFNKEDSDGRRVYQEFEVDDQARCQTFNLEKQADGTLGNHYYWRLVIEVGEDYIVLSKTDCDAGSDIPFEGDHISLLGNRSDKQRQNAILLSAYGADAPSYKQYRGVKSYNLGDADIDTQFSSISGNIVKGTFILESGKNVQDELDDVKVNWDKVLSQTDKEFTMWFYPYSPNANNLPESEWTTDELKALHEEDLFYNTSTDDVDGGKAWRYVYNEAIGAYMWEIVTDAETIKALEKAADAQKTADEVTAHLNEIVSDGILSSLEKKEVLKEWQEISSEYERNIDTAENFGLEETNDELLLAYKSAYMNLGRFMNDGDEWDGVSIPSWLADLTTNQVIDAATYRSKWVDYYNAERKFLNWLSIIAKNKADDARGEADKANDKISEITSDGILSALEKKEVLKEWVSIATSYNTNINNANTHNVSTSAYTSSYVALGTYLNGGSTWDKTSTPLWLLELDKNQAIDADAYRMAWVNYYSSEVDLLKAISDKIKADADEAQKTADSKRRNFLSQPVPPYDEGDRWVNATYGDIYENDDLVCINSKKEGESFSINDWKPVSYGTTAIIKVLEDKITLEVANREDALNEVVAKLDLYVTYDDLGNPYSGIEISADLIDLTGAITINSLSSSLRNTIDGKAENSDLASLESEINNSISSLNSRVYSLQTEVSAKASLDELNSWVDELESQIDGKVDTNLENAVVNGATFIYNGYIRTKFIKTEDLELKTLVSDSDTNGYKVTIQNGRILFASASNPYAIQINADDNVPAIWLYDTLGNGCGMNSTLIAGPLSSLDSNGLNLNGGTINRFAVRAIHTGVISTNSDFVVVKQNMTLSSPSSSNAGKVIFVKCSSSYTLTVNMCINADGGSSDYGTKEYKDNHTRGFITNGTYWYELNFTNT